MEAFFDLWWVFPAAVLFSTVAVGSGVSGALFFSPFFMLVVGLPPAQAVGAGLLTEVFGMGNGLRAYVRQRLVDYATARWLLAGALPATAVGALLAHQVPAGTLKLVFGGGLLLLAGFLIFLPAPEQSQPGAREGELLRKKAAGKGRTRSTPGAGRPTVTPPAGARPGSPWPRAAAF